MYPVFAWREFIWDVRETFVVRGRGAGRSLVVCIFIFMYESRDIFLL